MALVSLAERSMNLCRAEPRARALLEKTLVDGLYHCTPHAASNLGYGYSTS